VFHCQHFLNSAFTNPFTKYPVFLSHDYIPNIFLCIQTKLFPMQAIKAHGGGVKVWLHLWLSSAADEGEWAASFLSQFIPSEYC
jgi:hypothetical protein